MLKYTATPDATFFTFAGSTISFKVNPGEELYLNRGGKVIRLAAATSGQALRVRGEVKAGDIFTLGDKRVSFYEVPQSSILEKVRQLVPEKKIIVNTGPLVESSAKSKKTTLSVGIILLVILIASIGFGAKQKAAKEKAEKMARVEQEARAREEAGFFEGKPELFLDLTLLSAGFKGDILSASGGNLYTLDKNSKKVIGIEIANKKSKVVAGHGKLNEAFDLASYEDRVFVLDSEGIKEINEDLTEAVKKDWGNEALIYAFAGNLYVLDKEGGAIYRYAGSDGNFGSKQNWLASGTKPDFTKAKAWTFDGAVYVLVDNRILKFSRGSPQVFSLPAEILSMTSLYTDEENQFLYILDRENGKVWVLEKDGKFKAQYSAEEIKNAVGLIASEAEKKIILLTGEKLISLEMRHL